MSFAGDLTLVEVRDSWLKADGTPENGSITFTPSTRFRSLTTGQQVAPTGRKFALDNQGAIAVLLPATDDPDYDPSGFTYQVDVLLDGWHDSYSISVPAAAAGTGLDLGLMTKVAASGGVYAPAPDPVLQLALGRNAWLLS